MIYAFYFSPTGTTKQIIHHLANALNLEFGSDNTKEYDFTRMSNREALVEEINKTCMNLNEDDIVLFGVPVYAGRVPNILLKTLDGIRGLNRWVVPIVVYGNRDYDDALTELSRILKKSDFKILAQCAFIGEHSFSQKLAKGRPDDEDIRVIGDFALKILEKKNQLRPCHEILVNDEVALRPYYRPQNLQGAYFDFKPIKPVVNDKCNECEVCVSICPMNSIESSGGIQVKGICIKCCACVKGCPAGAISFEDPGFIDHMKDLEMRYSTRKIPMIYL